MTEQPGTPAVPPAETRPRCKNCKRAPWNGRSRQLLCDACEDAYLDLFNECSRDQDFRESDRELAW